MTKNYTTEELTRMSAKSKLVPSLPVVEELENINETLKAIANKEAPESTAPEVQKVSLEGISVITLKGDDGDTPTDKDLLKLITPLIPHVENGHTPSTDELLALIRPLIPAEVTDKKLLTLIRPLIPVIDTDLLAIEAADLATKRLEPFIPKGEDIKKDILGTPVRDSLEALQDDERLDSKAVKGLDKFEERIHSLEIRPISTGGGARGLMLYTNGTKRGMVNSLNLIPGTNVTMTYNYAYGRQDVTISSTGGVAGGSLSVLTATGTIDNSNMAFTVASTPTLVIINGISYRATGGAITWSYSGTTLTLSSPVGTGGDIYCLG